MRLYKGREEKQSKTSNRPSFFSRTVSRVSEGRRTRTPSLSKSITSYEPCVSSELSLCACSLARSAVKGRKEARKASGLRSQKDDRRVAGSAVQARQMVGACTMCRANVLKKRCSSTTPEDTHSAKKSGKEKSRRTLRRGTSLVEIWRK